ncbi:hypothetical protein [Rhodococcus sp. I2R]|uniref:hypothetical protein n=1 Tax=Rhodococcus sp. I2R TaxID=2855445 RepID=UPI001E290C56|nr:hypothetical protein [Rhodococcus sp. I2R]MCC8928805.1 hypothetical protein [Rhodococcus sp. I2R]
MENTLLVLLLLAGVIAFTYAASVGFRGKALYLDYYGEPVSDRVKADPLLRAEANRAFKVWCLAAAMLLVAPIAWIFSDFHRYRSVWELIGLAAYVFLAVIVGGYPLEKIKNL